MVRSSAAANCAVNTPIGVWSRAVSGLPADAVLAVLAVAERLAWADTLVGFRAAATRAVRELVPCDSVGYNEVDLAAGTTRLVITPDVEVPAGAYEAMARLAGQHPVIAAHGRGDTRVLRISDFLGQDEFHALELYREIYGPMGVEYQVSFVLPAAEPLVIGLALNRSEHDFTDAECAQLDLLRPHLEAALARVRAHDPPALLALTERQREIARLVGEGLTNEEIAQRIGIAAGTVKKHLEHVYAAVGVPNRAALARLAGRPPGH
jgi:DNA-binding CsgD family transcriptional regulator